MEGKEVPNGVAKLVHVNRLLGGPAAASGVETFLVGRVGTLHLEFGTQRGDARCGGPDATGEPFSTGHLDDGPRGPVGLDPSAEGGIAGREQGPAGGDGEHTTLR